MNENVSLIVNGRIYNYWSKYSIRKSIDNFSASFEFSTGAGFFRRNREWSIRYLDKAEIRFSDDLILKGIIDFVDIPPDPEDPIVIRGRDISSLIVDGCVTGNFSFKNVTIGELVKRLTSKFDAFTFTGDLSNRTSINIPPGQTVYEALVDACRKENQIIRNDFKGNISIGNYLLKTADNLIEGQNTKGIGYTMDGTHRYSEYIVYSQSKSKENFLTPEGSTLSKDSKADPEVFGRIHKPKVVSISSGDSPGIIKKMADYEELVSRSRSIRGHTSMKGFRQRDGSVWDIWSRSRVQAARISLDEDLLVSAITYGFDDSKGTVAEIELAGLDSFVPDPYVKEKKDGEEGSEFAKALK